MNSTGSHCGPPKGGNTANANPVPGSGGGRRCGSTPNWGWRQNLCLNRPTRPALIPVIPSRPATSPVRPAATAVRPVVTGRRRRHARDGNDASAVTRPGRARHRLALLVPLPRQLDRGAHGGGCARVTTSTGPSSRPPGAVARRHLAGFGAPRCLGGTLAASSTAAMKPGGLDRRRPDPVVAVGFWACALGPASARLHGRARLRPHVLHGVAADAGGPPAPMRAAARRCSAITWSRSRPDRGSDRDRGMARRRVHDPAGPKICSASLAHGRARPRHRAGAAPGAAAARREGGAPVVSVGALVRLPACWPCSPPAW